MSKRAPTPAMELMKVIGKSILFASMQFAIGSVEMSSKFSVRNFAKDQLTLQNAADALTDYMIIGFVWTLGTCLILFANYGIKGLIANLICNVVIMGWIYISYVNAFRQSAELYNLEMPKMFTNGWIIF